MKEQLLKNLRREKMGIVIYVILMTLILWFSGSVVYGNSAITFPIEGWMYGCQWLDFFLPLILSLPFSVPFYYQRKNGFVRYVETRNLGPVYVKAYLLSGVLGGFIITFLSYFLSLCFCVLVSYPIINPMNVHADYIFEYPLGNLQAYHPLVFGAAWCLWKGLWGGFFVGFSIGVAELVEHVFLVALIPFFYVCFENLVTAVLGLSRFSVVSVYVLDRMSYQVVQPYDILIGFCSFLIWAGGILLALKIRKKMMYE